MFRIQKVTFFLLFFLCASLLPKSVWSQEAQADTNAGQANQADSITPPADPADSIVPPPSQVDSMVGQVDQADSIIRPIFLIGGLDEDRLRVRQLRGEQSTAGHLIRSTSSLTETLEGDSAQGVGIILPIARAVWNSKIPLSMNDGSLWASRGVNIELTAGLRFQRGRVFGAFVPKITHISNGSYYELRRIGPISDIQDRFRLPWRVGNSSIDLPYRFGKGSRTAIDLGQSVLGIEAGPVDLGVATEDQWWGPGIRNAIVLSNNAPGFGHFFLRTAEPVRTGVGNFEAKLVTGLLSESGYFDADDSNDARAISALAIAWTPSFNPNVTFGLTRSVYSNLEERIGLPGRALDALIRWDQILASDDSSSSSSEQIVGFFARWVLPESGLELYTEWVRTEMPRSLRSFLIAPQHSQGYTLGLQWATDSYGSGLMRLQAEVSSLESTQKIGGHPTRGHYVSPHVPQGYTHRGQVIGAAIGPGSSSQWLATDYLADRWSIGLFVNRIRWDEDVYRFVYPFAIPQARDVSIVSGLRGGYRWNSFEVTAELGSEKRRNYLFQNISLKLEDVNAVDVGNQTLRITVSPLKWSP